MKSLNDCVVLLLSVFLISLISCLPPAAAKHRKSKREKTSGIYGTLVQIGFPPEHPYMGMEVPLGHMLVSVQRASDAQEIKRVTTNEWGNFKVELPPGKYTVEPIPPDPDPRGFGLILSEKDTVTVWKGFYTKAKPMYDGGW